MSDAFLTVENLGKTFGAPPFGVKAVQEVSFALGRNEVLGLVGESGSGKSTLGRLLLRLIEPSTGRIRLDGRDITGLSEAQLRPLRRQMQMVFQDPYASLNPRLRIGQTLNEALATHGLYPGRAQRKARIGELLELVGLSPDHASRYPHEFSGGQRQRIGIARALAVEPSLIVADEPVSALDVSVQAQVLNLLQDLRHRLGLSMVFISHDLEVVELMCDRIAVLYLGRIMEIGSAAEVYHRPRHPYTRALLAAVPQPDPKAPKVQRLMQGEPPSPKAPPSGCVFRTRCPYALPACAETVPELRETSPGHRAACLRLDAAELVAPAPAPAPVP